MSKRLQEGQILEVKKVKVKDIPVTGCGDT
jgi:hypothetical protein